MNSETTVNKLSMFSPEEEKGTHKDHHSLFNPQTHTHTCMHTHWNAPAHTRVGLRTMWSEVSCWFLELSDSVIFNTVRTWEVHFSKGPSHFSVGVFAFLRERGDRNTHAPTCTQRERIQLVNYSSCDLSVVMKRAEQYVKYSHFIFSGLYFTYSQQALDPQTHMYTHILSCHSEGININKWCQARKAFYSLSVL